MSNEIKGKECSLIKLQKEYWNKVIDKEYKKIIFYKDLNKDKRTKNQIKIKLDHDISSKLIQICKNDDMLMHMILITVLRVSINKYAQNQEFFIGVPQYIKSNDIKNNNAFILLGNNIKQDTVFKQELIQAKKEILEAYVYQFYEMKEIYNNRDVYNKVNIYCCMKNIHKNQQIEEILDLNNNDLTLIIEKYDNEVELIFNYWDESILNDINVIKNVFVNVLRSIIENIEINVNEIELLTQEEKNQILYKFNDTKIEYPSTKTIQELFEEQVDKNPDNVAVIYKEEKLTYKELNEKVNSLANTLREKGVKAESIVSIMVEPSIDMIVGIMAILKAGGAYLPIDPKQPKDRIKYILEECEVKVFLTQTKFIKSIEYDLEIIDLLDEKIYDREKNNLENINNPSSLAYIIYTSGSTGVPKGVLIEHRGVVRLVKNTSYIGINKDDVILQLSNYAFDASIFDIFGALLNGAKLMLTAKDILLEIDKLGKLILANKVSILFVTTALFNTIVDTNVEYLGNIRKVLFGGERISVKHAKKALEYLGQGHIIHLYGPTEGTVYATYHFIDNIEDDAENIPIGKPISNSTAYVVGKNNELLPIKMQGELYIGGDGIARGYLKRPGLTNEKFIDNPFGGIGKVYKTGDLVMWLPDGSIEFLGRIDQQVKIRGFRIELGEIENRLLDIEGIKETIVLDKGEADDKYLCAYYVSEKEYKVTELRQKLKMHLPDYMIPAYFMKLDKLPLTSNGKVDRRSLPEVKGQVNIETEYEAARNKTEEIIIKAWSKVLGIQRVGINDNFFDLGGNSLNAVKIASILRDNNIEILTSDIFMYQNIKSISDDCIINKISNEEKDDLNSMYVGSKIADVDEYVREVKKNLNIQYAEFTKKIVAKKIVSKYKVSEIQKITQKTGIVMSGTKIDFNFEVDINRLEAVVTNLINEQGVLRGAIVEKDSEMYMYEYDKIESIKLPFIDLSNIDKEQKISLFREAISDINIKIQENNNYVENKIYYALILVKNMPNNYTLYMLANHLIFDGMSSEIVKNLVVKKYKNYENYDMNSVGIDEKITYSNYINQIEKGPEDISEKEIVEKFNLNEFLETCLIYDEKINKVKHKLTIKKLEFDLPTDLLNTQEQIWEFAFGKFVEIYRKNLDIDNVPVNILNMGRRFGEKNYFTTIGEFLDTVPYIGKNEKANLKAIDNILKVASEKNINFVTIQKNDKMSKEYKQVSEILNKAKFNDSDIPIFNYLGLYDTDYNLASLFEVSHKLKYNQKYKKQRGVNCYIKDSKLIMFIDVLEDRYNNNILDNSNLK